MKYRPLIWLCLVFTPVFVGLRIYQLLKTIDPTNGFYDNQYSVFTSVILIVFGACCLLLLLASRFLIHKSKTPLHLPRKNTALGMASLLVAAGLIVDVVIEIRRLSSAMVQYKNVLYLLSLITIVAAICFFFIGYRLLCGKGIAPGLSIVVLIWSTLRLFIRYTVEFNGAAIISENIYDIFALCGMMMFFLYQSHICASLDNTKAARWIYGFGLVGSMFCFLVTIPRMALMVTGNAGQLTHSSVPSFGNLAIGIYILVFLIVLSSRKCQMALKEDGLEPSKAPELEVSTVAGNAEQEVDEQDLDAFIRNYKGSDDTEKLLEEEQGTEETSSSEISENGEQ